MKKRTLPILLLLAGLSAAALAGCGHEHTYSWKETEDGTKHYQECECGVKTDEEDHVDTDSNGKCDVCDADVHKHEYEWKSDADKHWQECGCEDKINEGAHADENADGKCDTCERAYFAVTFAMHNHGTAPDAQKVISGGVAVEPEAPADDDAYKFKGWYKDRACTQAFDFTADKIEEATVIHAKWEEDTTAGASKKHAHQLTIEEESLKEVKNGAVVYFVYTAETSGRFTVSLGAGVNSQNSTFTTSITGDTVYGKDQSTDSVTFDMDATQTVYIMLVYQGEDGEDVMAGVMIGETIDEPLPADRFPDGEYYNDIYSVVIDREKKEITYEGTAYPFKYIAGKFDRISYNVTVGSDTTTFYLSCNADGSYQFTNSKSTGSGSKLEHFEPQDPVALSNVFGYYEPKGDATNNIEGIYIYTNSSTTATSVRYKQVFRDKADKITINYSDMKSAVYDTEKNRLTFDGYVITLNLTDDGSVESIRVGIKTYVRKGDTVAVPPESLPVEENAEYFGTSHAIRTPSGSQYFGATGADKMIVMEYAETTGKYTVLVVSDTETYYQLTISADKKTITLFDAEGTQLDTLTKFEYVWHELPAEEQEITIAESDFQKGLVYLYTVKTAGWYAFTGIPSGVKIHYNLNENDPMLDYASASAIENGVAVRFEEGTTVGVFMAVPEEITFTVAPAEDPAGHSAENPKALTDGSATIGNINAGTTYYFEYTATEAGNLAFNAFYDSGSVNNADFIITYTINGEQKKFNDYSAKDAITRVTATAGQTFKINVIVGEYQFNKSSVTVAVVEDLSVGATEIVMTGTPANDSLTVSATATTGGNCYIATTKGSPVAVTGSSAFTIKMQSGASIVAKEKDGAFTASIPAGEEIYFKIVSAVQQSVTFSQTFAKGSMGYPITASAEAGENTVTLANGEVAFIALSAGKYIFKAPNYSLTIGNTDIPVNTVVEIQAGDLLFFNYRDGENESATLTIIAPEEIFTEEQAGTYKSADGNVTLELTTNNCGTYTAKNGPYTLGGAVIIEAGKNGSYVFTYEYFDYGSFAEITHTVMFRFGSDGIELMDDAFPESEESPFSLEKEVVFVGTVYTGTMEHSGGTTSVTFTVNDDFTQGIFVWEDVISETVTITATGENTYKFVYAEGQYDESTITITVNTDGTLTLVDAFFTTELGLGSGVLNKIEDPDEPVETVTYTGTLDNGMGTSYNVKVEIMGNKATFYSDFSGELAVEGSDLTITETNGTYSFEIPMDGMSDTCSYTIDGDTIVVEHTYYGNGTLTKQA